MTYSVTSFYAFQPVADPLLLKEELEARAEPLGLRGLIVLGSEGWNGSVAGLPASIELFQQFVVERTGERIPFKDSVAELQPFSRFKVDVRPEIITTRRNLEGQRGSVDTYLSPEQWHRTIEEDPSVLVLDTRNGYETEIGAFRGAVDPNIDKFSQFPEYLEMHPLPRDKKILMYCTGGIRCEKAVVEMRRRGYDQVFQLEGGILKYLEAFPEALFEGECFVFDRRVAVDQKLRPSKIYKLCPHCGNPAKETILCTQCGEQATVCNVCLEQRDDRKSCSKNCAYHLRRVASAAN